MKFANGAFISLVAGCYYASCTQAFLIISPGNSANRKKIPRPSTKLIKNTIASSFHKSCPTLRWMAEGDQDDDYDEHEEPLAKGVDSVSWLPSVSRATRGSGAVAREDAEILPLFPLGGIVYIPNSEHVLNIFEPRYRQMYTDILMNGTKRFVVAMSHPSEPGKFAQTGVLFELEELKEVSEQTADQIKYICNHKVTGRVTIHKILNPEAWETRETYLKVEGTISNDSASSEGDGSSESDPQEERAVQESFSGLVEMQHELEEDVRFTRASVGSLAVKPGAEKDGLWQTISLWQNFADQRLMARQNELQRDFQERLQEFLKKEKGLNEGELPSAIGFQELSPDLQKEVQDLQKRMSVELQPLVLESSLTMQKILEAEDHGSRCKLLRFFIDSERKRLTTKKTLKGMFSGAVSDSSSLPSEELISDVNEDTRKSDTSGTERNENESLSIFPDEPDAFQ